MFKSCFVLKNLHAVNRNKKNLFYPSLFDNPIPPLMTIALAVVTSDSIKSNRSI